MFLLDTNVVSELAKPRPHPDVVAWVGAQSPLALHLSVITLGEIERGIARLPLGEKRARLETWAYTMLPRWFTGRILAIDGGTAVAWGQILAACEQRGLGAPPAIDGLLLGSAKQHRLTLVTRNVRDVAGRGVAVFDPWTGTSHPAS